MTTAQDRTVQDIYELSPMQQGMLFHTLYAPQSGVYFEQRSGLLTGSLDIEAFKGAWQSVVERHAVLRTAFYWEVADKPLQVVYPHAELPWLEEDWQRLTEAEQAAKLNDFLQGDRTQGFRLDQAPLMRCALFRLGPERHRFVWSHHHLLMDGWCNALLIKEVMTCYTARRQGQTVALPSPRPYRDYILWLQQQDQQAAKAYWHSILAGFTVPTPLGIHRSHTASIVSQAKHQDQWLTLPQTLTADLNAFTKQHHLTLNTLLQGAWALMLGRYGDTSDVMFGATVSGRPPSLPGAASMVGLFINTVPVRVSLPLEQPLLPWLYQIQESQRDRETYAFSPLTDIQSWSEVSPGTPLFESLLVFENYPTSLSDVLTDRNSGLAIEETRGFEQTNYPLALFVIPGEALTLRVNYACDRIPTRAAQRLLSHLETLLQGMVANPNQPLAALPLLTPSEHRLIEAWNQTEQSIPQSCVHELVAAQAEKTPGAIAIIFENTSLSYRELNHRTNQLASFLKQQGLQQGHRVAVCLERSTELVITLLAILKAGATYVPLDPTYPTERLRFILQDAQVSLLITANASPVSNTLPAIESITNHAIPILNLLDETGAIAHSP
ncbi:MAG: condensation domain-containing protein, partial [Synechococcales bacterium]|nr:condensation domain-containing protein [Synechococcales bacterium]